MGLLDGGWMIGGLIKVFGWVDFGEGAKLN